MNSLRVHRGCNQVTQNECFEKLKLIHVMKIPRSLNQCPESLE